MKKEIKYALYNIEGGMKLIKTFNSLDELIEYGENNEIEADIFRVADPDLGLKYDNIFQYDDHLFNRIHYKKQFESGDIDELEYQNEIRRIENREKRDLKEFLASQSEL